MSKLHVTGHDKNFIIHNENVFMY